MNEKRPSKHTCIWVLFIIYLCKSGYMFFRFVTTETKRANALFILNKPIDFVLKENRSTSCLIVGLPAKLDSASLLHHFACRLDDGR